MRKNILAIAAVAALVSGPVLAVNTHEDGGAVSGASVSSSAFAVSSGNGSAFTETRGFQESVGGYNGSVSASGWQRKGEASVSGVAGARGAAFSQTSVSGAAAAGSETVGKSFAVTGGHAGFDTHGKNPEGHVSGSAFAKNGNSAGTGGAFYGGAKKWNSSGTIATFGATAAGDRDGGYWGHPTTDSVSTSADASSESYENGGGYRYGLVGRSGGSYTRGGAEADAWAKSGNTYSHN